MYRYQESKYSNPDSTYCQLIPTYVVSISSAHSQVFPFHMAISSVAKGRVTRVPSFWVWLRRRHIYFVRWVWMQRRKFMGALADVYSIDSFQGCTNSCSGERSGIRHQEWISFRECQGSTSWKVFTRNTAISALFTGSFGR